MQEFFCQLAKMKFQNLRKPKNLVSNTRSTEATHTTRFLKHYLHYFGVYNLQHIEYLYM